ncbi:MAG: stage III sporulation protein AC [Clostridia bacterium]|nr:stage III sporulation protein AC [Clostridia bacterium]
MGVEIIFKIAAIGILTTVINQILSHAGKSEIATLTNLAGLVIVLAMVLSMIGELFENVKLLFNLF